MRQTKWGNGGRERGRTDAKPSSIIVKQSLGTFRVVLSGDLGRSGGIGVRDFPRIEKMETIQPVAMDERGTEGGKSEGRSKM